MGYESQRTKFIEYTNPKDFNVTASAYAIIKDADGTIKNNGTITLTAHLKNIPNSQTVYWYKGNQAIIVEKDGENVHYSGKTLAVSEVGTYAAKIFADAGKTTVKYEDSVTIVEVQDGQTGPDGKSAISVVLTNPVMTFNTSVDDEEESCEVIVYEGGEPLSYWNGEEIGNGEFRVYQVINNVNVEIGKSFDITEKSEKGSATYKIEGKRKDGTSFNQDATVHWTVVSNGNDAKDLNLHANTYFVTKKKNGVYSPTSLTFTTQSSNLSGSYTWKYGTTEITNTSSSLSLNNTSTLTYPLTVSVRQGGLSDSVVVTLIDEAKDGEDAIGIALSNPTMTFNTSTSTSETCRALVVNGTTEIFYSHLVATSGSNWYYTLENSSSSANVKINTDNTSENYGLITVSKPSASTSYNITITVYCGKTKKREVTIPIQCVRVSNGTTTLAKTLSLDNEYDTVVRSSDGSWISTQQIVVKAIPYSGANVASSGSVNLITPTTTGLVEYENDSTSDKSKWNYKIESDSYIKILTIRPSKLPSTFTEETFKFEWRAGTDDTSTFYASKNFVLKSLTDIADYDLIIPQTVFNKKNISTTSGSETVIPVSVQKKSKDGTEIIQYGVTLPLRLYKVTTTTTNGATSKTYTEINGGWANNNVKFSSAEAVHLVLGSKETIGSTQKTPKIIWDEEVIEVVEDGARGLQGLSGLVFSLDNDSDVFVKKKDGTKISNNILVTAQLSRDGIVESGATFTLSSYPEAFKGTSGMDSEYADFIDGVLTIKNVPSSFESGDFVIGVTDTDLEKTFTLRAVQSNVDYDLWIDKTLVNNTSGSVTSKIYVKKTKEDGTVETVLPRNFGTEGIILTVDGSIPTTDNPTLEYVAYACTKGQKTPVLVTLHKNTGSSSSPKGFLWDEETIEFVQNGAAAQDFSVTASAYAFVESTTNPVNSIDLKADLKNLEGTVNWYKDTSTDIIGSGTSLTIYRTEQADDKSKPYGTGIYTAKLYKNGSLIVWEDSVTIGQVSDGATGPGGKPAISISLTNPTMVFNSNNSSKTETCKVIVYEGGTTLSPGSEFSITASTNADQDEVSGDTITIAKPTAATTKTYEVTIKPTAGGAEQTSTITINCTLVDDGEDGVYISLQADPAVIHSTDLTNDENIISLTAYEKVGGKETKPLTLTLQDGYSYRYKWNTSQSYDGAGFDFDGNKFEIDAIHSGSPKTLKVELYKSSVLIASQTVEVLYDVARREYFLYHDITSNAAPELPTELDWREFREKNSDTEATTDAAKHKGWYKTQDKDDSYYYISKRNAYDEEEQAGKPWFGPMEIKQTPQTYDSWWKALDNATKNDKTKGIYTLQDNAGVQAVGINADFIKAGALTIKPKTYVTNSGWVDDTDGKSVFETGWKFKKKTGNSSNGLNDAQIGDVLEPYVSIGGVDFTGFIPQKIGGRLLEYEVGEYSSSTEYPHYNKGTLGVRLASAQSMTFAKYLKYEDNILQVGNATSNSFASNEVYYRLCVATEDKTWDLCPGKSYTLTGSAKMVNFSTGDVLKFRAESYNNSWAGVSLIEVAKNSSYQTFECKFTVPLNAKGFHLGFQPYSSTGSSITSNNNFKGYFYLKDLKLIENALDVSGTYSWKFDQDNGLYMWQGAQTTTPIMKVESGGLELTGTIKATGGSIADWTIKNVTSGSDKESSITFGTPGGSGGFGMYTYYPDAESTKVAIGNSGLAANWRLLIGNNFGVNSSGFLYASRGSFGRLSILENGELLYENQQGDKYEKISLSLNGLRCISSTGESVNSLLTSTNLVFDNSTKNYISISDAGIRLQTYKTSKWDSIDIADSGISWYKTDKKGTSNSAFFSMAASDTNGLVFSGSAMNGLENDYKSLKGLIGKVQSAISLAGDVESQLATASMNSSAAVTTASEAKTIANNNKVSTNNAYTFYARQTTSSGTNQGIITFTVSGGQITNISYV